LLAHENWSAAKMPSVTVADPTTRRAADPATSCRIGIGYDIHATTAGDHIWLGGVKIVAPFALKGYSDADVLLHAITDAILGALGDGDIGSHFPPSDSANKNRPSRDFLEFAVGRMNKRGFRIENIDSNVVCELPKIDPVREVIKNSIAAIARIRVDQISVKGRTHEKLDAAGRGEAVICQAVVLLTT